MDRSVARLAARGTLRNARRRGWLRNTARTVWWQFLREAAEPLVITRNAAEFSDDWVCAPLDEFQRAVIAALARRKNSRRVLEIGTLHGRTTLTIARHNPDTQILTLDLPTLAHDFGDPSTNESLTPGRDFVDTPESGRITQLFGTTASVDLAKHGPFDFAYIDADHAYDWVKRDTEAVLPVLADGGLIVWDDYLACPGVYQYVLEFAERRGPLVHIAGTRLAVYGLV